MIEKQNGPAAAAYYVSQVSLSNAHHWSERRDLGDTTSFVNHDFVHKIHRYTYDLHPQSCQGQLVLEYLLLVLDDKEVLVQKVERLKRFQAHFEVLIVLI